MSAAYYPQVQKIYVAYYGRPADPAGLQYWSGQLAANGGNLTSIINAFGNSAESTALYAGASNSAKVTAIYQQLFNRAPDSAGLNFYTAELTAGRMTAASIALNVANGAQGTDATYLANKVTVGTAFTDALTLDGTAAVAYTGTTAITAARSLITGTTTSAATTNVASTITSIKSGGGAAAGQTFTLTAGADIVEGSTSNDEIKSPLGTLSTLDDINGGAGTDSLTVTFAPIYATAGSATAAAPSISNVETITLTNNADTATFNMANVDTSVSTLTLNARNTLAVTNLATTAVSLGMSASVTLDLATATASTATYGLTLNVNAGSAATVVFAEDAGLTAADTLTLNAIGNFGNGTTGQLRASGVEQIVLKGAGNIDLNLSSAGNSATIDDLTGINGADLAGSLTLRVGAGTGDLALNDLNIAGGAGNDTITYLTDLSTNDSVDGNGGSDVLNAVLTGGYVRPTVSDVETFNFLVNSTGATADFRDISGVSTLNVLLGTGATFDKLGSAVTTINVNSSDSTANGLIFNYGTAAGASNVTLNLGNAVQGTQQATAATATAMGVSGVSFSGNSGSLTLKVGNSATYSANSITALDFTAVTIDAASGTLSMADDINVGSAQTVTLRAGAAASLASTADLSAINANAVTLNAAGQSASITLGTAYLGTANTLTINTDAAMTGNQGVAVSGLTFQSANAATGALGLDTITINALGGDVTIGSAVFLSGATSMNLGVNVRMGSTAVAVTLGQLTIDGVASAGTASEQSLSVNLAGSGSFALNTALVTTSVFTFSVNSTALVSGSNITIDLSDIDASATVVSAVFGRHSGTFIGGDGNDSIELGLGDVTVNGGLGNDTITLNNTAASIVAISGATTTAGFSNQGVDTIIGAGAGDVILFGTAAGMSAAGTAATARAGSAAFATGTATTATQFGTASFTAIVNSATASAVDMINIYTANGDTILEYLIATASATGAYSLSGASAGDQFLRVVLSNKDFTAITAAFQLNTTGSGVSITLL